MLSLDREERGDIEKEKPKLYAKYVKRENGEIIPEAYAFGDPWVAQAMFMDDIQFKTPEEAEKWWVEKGSKL